MIIRYIVFPILSIYCGPYICYLIRPLPSSSQTGVGAASSQPAPSTKGPVYMPEKTVKISEVSSLHLLNQPMARGSCIV